MFKALKERGPQSDICKLMDGKHSCCIKEYHEDIEEVTPEMIDILKRMGHPGTNHLTNADKYMLYLFLCMATPPAEDHRA